MGKLSHGDTVHFNGGHTRSMKGGRSEWDPHHCGRHSFLGRGTFKRTSPGAPASAPQCSSFQPSHAMLSGPVSMMLVCHNASL